MKPNLIHSHDPRDSRAALPLQASTSATSDDALDARGFSTLPEPGEKSVIMYMPAGRHTINPSQGGKGVTVDLLVDARTADEVEARRQAIVASGKKPFFSIFHDTDRAGFWPEKFFHDTRKGPDGVVRTGTYASGVHSESGLQAVQGKDIYSFSPTFFVDDVKGKPARVIANTHNTRPNMGAFENDPAFAGEISPLWAKNASTTDAAGAPSDAANQPTTDDMKKTIAELQAAQANLETTVKALEAKTSKTEIESAQLEARQSELRATSAELRTAELEARDLSRRENDAKASVQAAVKDGRLPAQNTELQAKWVKQLTDDPANVVMLDSMSKATALTARHAPNGNVHVISEDPLMALKAYAAEKDAALRGRIYKREFSALLAKGGDLPFHQLPLDAANSVGTVVGNLVSQRVLELLKYSLPTLGRISTDFSDAQVKYGQTVLSRIITPPTVGTYNTTTGYPVADATATDVSVVINQHKCVEHSFNAEDLAGTARRLFDEFAPAAAYALTKDLIDYVYALITTANFTNTPVDAALIDFGRASVIDIGTAQDESKVPDFMRTLLLNAAYFGQLSKDQALITLAAFQQSGIITAGVLPDVHGYQVIKAANLPSTGNLKGFAMSPSALVAATRLPLDYTQVLPGASNGNVTTVQHPDIGASCVQTMYVNHTLGTANWRLAWMYGAAKGQIAAGQILRSGA